MWTTIKLSFIAIVLSLTVSQANACGFFTKLKYNGSCSQSEWVDTKVAAAIERGDSTVVAGKEFITIIDGQTTSTNIDDLVDAYNKGGKEAVIALIGLDELTAIESAAGVFDEAAAKAADEAKDKAEYVAQQAAKGEDACFDPTCGGKYNDAISAEEAANMK